MQSFRFLLRHFAHSLFCCSRRQGTTQERRFPRESIRGDGFVFTVDLIGAASKASSSGCAQIALGSARTTERSRSRWFPTLALRRTQCCHRRLVESRATTSCCGNMIDICCLSIRWRRAHHNLGRSLRYQWFFVQDLRGTRGTLRAARSDASAIVWQSLLSGVCSIRNGTEVPAISGGRVVGQTRMVLPLRRGL